MVCVVHLSVCVSVCDFLKSKKNISLIFLLAISVWPERRSGLFWEGSGSYSRYQKKILNF